jgi:UDP-glucose 4-epimerase
MILVFGAGGFIGTYPTEALARDGRDVAAIDISEIAQSHYERQGIPYHRADITQADAFDRLPIEGVSAVVHLACVQPANVSEQKYNPIDYIRVNAIGTLNILEFCRRNKIPKIVYTCSHRNTQGLWAEKAGTPILESDGRALQFTGDYAMFSISESAAADCVEHYSQTYGIEGITLRLPPVYGYGPHTEIFKDGKPIKTGFQVFIENAEQGKPLVLWGDPQNGRDIVYVKDVVSAIEIALEKPGVEGLYNISSGHRLSLKEQAESIIRVFSSPGRVSQIQYQREKPNLIENYVYDIGKARRVLGWQPKYSFEDMLIDYRKEQDSGRFAYLLEKRRLMMQESSPAAGVTASPRLAPERPTQRRT